MRHRRLSADGTPEFYSMRCAERILYNYTGVLVKVNIRAWEFRRFYGGDIFALN